MYAIVEINGKQYHAEQGKDLVVDRFDAMPGQSIVFEKCYCLVGMKQKSELHMSMMPLSKLQ